LGELRDDDILYQGLPGAVSLGIFAFSAVFWMGQKINTIFIDSLKKD
jgi:hypothetical protein